MKKEKVYCKDCKHFYDYVMATYLGDHKGNMCKIDGECEHPSCFIVKEKITAYSKEECKERITDYYKKNNKNNCVNYEKKIIKEKQIKKSVFKRLFGG